MFQFYLGADPVTTVRMILLAFEPLDLIQYDGWGHISFSSNLEFFWTTPHSRGNHSLGGWRAGLLRRAMQSILMISSV